MGCQNIFFIFWLFASFLAKGIMMPDEQNESLLSGLQFCLQADQAVNDWCWHWSGFCSLKPREEKRWKLFTFLHVQIHIFHATTEMESLGFTGTSAQWTKNLVNLRLQPYHMTRWESCTRSGVTAPSLTSKKRSLDEFSRAGSTGLSSSLETTPRCPPRYDGKQSCVSLLACKCASGLTMFYHWQQCKMLLKEHSVHWAACSRSGRGKDRTPWILDSCSQGSINPTHLKVRHLLEVSFLCFLCGQWKDISRGQFFPS